MMRSEVCGSLKADRCNTRSTERAENLLYDVMTILDIAKADLAGAQSQNRFFSNEAAGNHRAHYRAI
jgi:hypothetical protein